MSAPSFLARLYREDCARIIASIGEASPWFLSWSGTRAYVRAWDRKARKQVSIGLLVKDAGENKGIRHLDGDRLNLRRDNLVAKSGLAGQKRPFKARGERQAKAMR